MNHPVTKHLAPCALVLVLGAAASAWAQTDSHCGVDPHAVILDMTLHLSYTTNACGCSGSGSVWAACADIVNGYGHDDPTCGTCPTSVYMDYHADADGKNGTTDPCITPSTSAAGRLGDSSSASLNWCCTSGTTNTHSHTVLGKTYLYDTNGALYCIEDGLGLASAGAGGSKTFTFCTTPTFLEDLSVALDVDLSTYDPSTLGDTFAVFVSSTKTRGGNTVCDQGMYVFFQDGTSSRLGFFADSTFDPTQTGHGPNITVNNFAMGGLPSGSGDVTYTVKYDVISSLNGNMDPEVDGPNPIVCYRDRAILHGLLGVSIGNPLYNPRCDLNFDGIIDAADMAIFNTIPCNANWDCSTTAPVLNTNDFSAFLNSYAANDPVADVDGSGSINVNDFSAFLNAYAAGCN